MLLKCVRINGLFFGHEMVLLLVSIFHRSFRGFIILFNATYIHDSCEIKLPPMWIVFLLVSLDLINVETQPVVGLIIG